MSTLRIMFLMALLLASVSVFIGCGASSADPKAVAMDPQNYAGKTLESKVWGMETPRGVGVFYVPITREYLFSLKVPSIELGDRVSKAATLTEKGGFFVIKYKVYSPPPSDIYKQPLGELIDIRMK